MLLDISIRESNAKESMCSCYEYTLSKNRLLYLCKTLLDLHGLRTVNVKSFTLRHGFEYRVINKAIIPPLIEDHTSGSFPQQETVKMNCTVKTSLSHHRRPIDDPQFLDWHEMHNFAAQHPRLSIFSLNQICLCKLERMSKTQRRGC